MIKYIYVITRTTIIEEKEMLNMVKMVCTFIEIIKTFH